LVGLVFKDSGTSKRGQVEVDLTAKPLVFKNYKPDQYGRVVTLKGEFLTGMEGFSDLKRSWRRYFELATLTLRVGGKVVQLPKKELERVVVKTLAKSKDPQSYEVGVQLITSPQSDEIKVALCGGDGVATFIKVWVFDAKKGFVKSGVEGPP